SLWCWGLESAALSLGPAKKDEELAKSPGPLSSCAFPVRGGSHEADASTGDWGGQSRELLRIGSRIKFAKHGKKVRGAESESDATNAAPLKLQGVNADHFPVCVEKRAAAVPRIDG